jgi:uncharacterized protein DUF5683
MGKGPKYKALYYLFFCKPVWLTSLIVAITIITANGLMAQDGVKLVAPLDSNLHSTPNPDNIVVKKDTVTQSLASFAHDSTDSTAQRALVAKAPLHSARKAAYLSAVLPGLGQAYNKKYWKIPIVYAGFGGLSYALYYTVSNFTGYRGAYRQQVALIPNYNASYNGVSDAATLKTYRDYFKKYVDISSIGMGVWYLLNVVDATVDAHLMGWNMKDDLSVSWNPVVISSPNYNTAAAGVAFTLHF